MWRAGAATLVIGTAALAPVVAPAYAVAVPAHADTGFWRSAGLRGVDAFGVYRAGRAKVRLAFLLKDLKKDRYAAAVRLTFTERRHHRSVRVLALRGGGPARRWAAVRSANTGHLYVQECTGTWRRKRFRIHACGTRHRRY